MQETAAQPPTLVWECEVLDRFETDGVRWRPCGKLHTTLINAQEAARQLQHKHGAARLTAPGFEVVARRDYFCTKRTEGVAA